MKEFYKKHKEKLELIAVIVVSILFPVALMVSAEEQKKNYKPEIVIIDGCEYIHTHAVFGADKFEHKANCKNH